MKSLALPLAALLAVGGCSFDRNGVDQPDAGQIDASAIDASPPDAEVPGCTPTCTDATHLDDCSGGAPVECLLGCKTIDDVADRCNVLVPSNGASAGQLQNVFMGLRVPTNATLVANTQTGEIKNGNDTVRAAGEGVVGGIGFFTVGDVGVFAVKALQVDAKGTFAAVGKRALVVLSAGDVVIRGSVDVSAVCRGAGGAGDDFSCGGPAGGDGSAFNRIASGCAPGGDGTSLSLGDETGGGGGGFHDNGAPGGNSGLISGGPGGTNVVSNCPDETLDPIGGGSGGGQGGGEGALFGGQGGGGGGAVQISSFTLITIEKVGTDVGSIQAQGGGGASGGASFGGGGGGSGGAILLEAPRIVINGGLLAANGGGGGQGNGPLPGQNGQPSTQRAKGGGTGDGHGGEGGAQQGLPTPGFSSGLGNFDGTGGGGAAAGRIRLNSAQTTKMGGPVISPAETSGLPGAG